MFSLEELCFVSINKAGRKIYTSKNNLCVIQNCQCKTAYEETKNKRTSKHLCQHHSKFIEVVCSYGNHTMKIKPRYFKGFEADYICNKCNIIKHNKSEKMREVSKKQGLKNVSVNGSLYKYNQSEQHHKQAKINIQKSFRVA